ncbi:MAG: hypothetical protein JNM45_09950 [Rhizobiales bacterium]|nr:hypothetical protein [Hyphomicrobiales bacterium]
MSKLMQVLGLILLAAGVFLAVMGLVNQAQLQVRGIDMASAINLIVGGILSIGIGGIISAVGATAPLEDYADEVAPAPARPAPQPVAEAKTEETRTEEAAPAKPLRFPSFGRKAEEAGAAAAAATATSDEPLTPAVKETIDALEQAKTDLENALTGSDSVETAAAAPGEAAAPPADGELYVVEDKVIRGRSARILSDGTVEAETDEGWMRFENLEHLDEYLDAVEQA